MIKRFVVSFALIFILFVQFVSAQMYLPPIRQAIDSVITSLIDIFEPILSALFGGSIGWTGLYLFERLLLFAMFISIIYIVLDKRVPLFDEQKGIKILISVIIPLIGIRFIQIEWLNAIFVQYQILAIVLGVIFPMMIFFFFLYGTSGDYPMLRKVGWIVFIGIYIGLWASEGTQGTGKVYFWAVIVAIILLLFDNRIYRQYQYKELIKRDQGAKHREIGRINMEIQETERMIANSAINPTYGRKHIKELTKLKEWLFKQF